MNNVNLLTQDLAVTRLVKGELQSIFMQYVLPWLLLFQPKRALWYKQKFQRCLSSFPRIWKICTTPQGYLHSFNFVACKHYKAFESVSVLEFCGKQCSFKNEYNQGDFLKLRISKGSAPFNDCAIYIIA